MPTACLEKGQLDQWAEWRNHAEQLVGMQIKGERSRWQRALNARPRGRDLYQLKFFQEQMMGMYQLKQLKCLGAGRWGSGEA